ncbi:deubiquitinase DESI2 [Scaptodrosophila lebanonensis]|uniref:Deubiquitinase DESI2 n=1 Tax=Drosophila lebanonensis TaxID=7225 RepID=A0A6J2U1B2_DROLE|nr:deubiquitinase DESI2 [Scaptodrosophila lebanonensis]
MFCHRLPILSCFTTSKESCRDELLPLNVVGKEPVVLNVYDMFSINDYTTPLGLGVFHSGVQVYDTEFAYGGHRYPVTGIFEIAPRNNRNELGEQFQYRESISIGYTELSCEEVHRIVDDLGHQFHGDCYHLTNNNCNHFSNTFTRVLCGQEIPPWINRLAYFVTCVPFLHRCLPLEWMTPSQDDGPQPPLPQPQPPPQQPQPQQTTHRSDRKHRQHRQRQPQSQSTS